MKEMVVVKEKSTRKYEEKYRKGKEHNRNGIK